MTNLATRMKKIIPLFCALSLIFSVFGAYAQTLDLGELRERPDTNKLPVERNELRPQPIALSSSSLDLRVIYWRHWTTFGINVNQAAFSDNWSGGGISSFAIGSNFNHKSDYTKNNTNFITEFVFQYGYVKNKGQSARKSNDRLFWDNKLSLNFSKNWSLYTSLTFESQFNDGYRYTTKPDGTDSLTLLTSFMAPGYLTESFGLEYKLDKTFSLRLGTGTARQTFILDNRLKPTEASGPRFGVQPGRVFQNDLAFQVTANLDKNLAPNLNLKSRYNVFANYKKLSDPSHRLDATLTARVTRLINVTMKGELIYDTDLHSQIQASQTLALGLSYKIPR